MAYRDSFELHDSNRLCDVKGCLNQATHMTYRNGGLSRDEVWFFCDDCDGSEYTSEVETTKKGSGKYRKEYIGKNQYVDSDDLFDFFYKQDKIQENVRDKKKIIEDFLKASLEKIEK